MSQYLMRNHRVHNVQGRLTEQIWETMLSFLASVGHRASKWLIKTISESRKSSLWTPWWKRGIKYKVCTIYKGFALIQDKTTISSNSDNFNYVNRRSTSTSPCDTQPCLHFPHTHFSCFLPLTSSLLYSLIFLHYMSKSWHTQYSAHHSPAILRELTQQP